MARSLLPLLLLIIIVAACGGDPSQAEARPAADGAIATGVVVDVRGTITQVDEFDLLLSDGSRFTIVPRGGVLERSGFSPAHLREHMALTTPISVIYREEDGLNIMTGIDDAED